MAYKPQSISDYKAMLKREVDLDDIEKLEGELKHQEEIAESLNMNIESDLLMDHLKYLDPIYNKIVDLKAWIRILKQCR